MTSRGALILVPICHVQSAAIIQGKYWRSQYLRQRLRLFKQDMDDDRHRCFEGGRIFSVPPRSLFLWRLMKTIHNSHPSPAAPRLTDTMILRLLAPLPSLDSFHQIRPIYQSIVDFWRGAAQYLSEKREAGKRMCWDRRAPTSEKISSIEQCYF